MLNESLYMDWQQTQRQLQQFQQRWLVGDGASAVPALHLLANNTLTNDEQNLTALALFSQAQLFVKAQTPAELQPMPELPMLSLQLLPTRYRAAFRRLQSELRQHPLAMYALLSQLAAFNYAPHPLDWLPKATDGLLPKQLLPWLYFHWGYFDKPELNITTWPLFSASQKAVLLKQMRETQPEAARALLQACLAQEPADIRAALLSVLQFGLERADLQLIEQFANERAASVRTICWHLQLQLGLAIERQTPPTEITEWLQQERYGLLLQRKKIVAREPKNSVQGQNLLKALAAVDLIALASNFGLGIDEFFEQWSFADHQSNFGSLVNQTLLQCAAMQLTAASMRLLLARIAKDVVAEIPIKKLTLDTLLNRLSRSERSEYVQLIMTRCQADTAITDFAELNIEHFAWLTPEVFKKHIFKQQLSTALAEYTKAKDDSTNLRKLTHLMHWLGLMLPTSSAKIVRQSAIEAGIASNDAMLDTLSFHLSLQQGPHDE